VLKTAVEEDAVSWFRFVREQMEKCDMTWALWNCMGSNMGMYDEEKKDWIETRKKAIMLE